MSGWDEELRGLRLKDTPMVYLSGLLSEMDLPDEDMAALAERAFSVGIMNFSSCTLTPHS